jgi:hypothetical protein
LPDDGTRPEKADAGYDLGGDPGRVELETTSPERHPRERLETVGRDKGKQGRPLAEQDVRPEPNPAGWSRTSRSKPMAPHSKDASTSRSTTSQGGIVNAAKLISL